MSSCDYQYKQCQDYPDQNRHNVDSDLHPTVSCVGPEGGGGGGGGADPLPHTPLENHKAIGFLSYTGADLLPNHKGTMPAFNVGPSSARQRNAIKRRCAGGPMMARFQWYLDPLSTH